jgi:hypothetical protein
MPRQFYYAPFESFLVVLWSKLCLCRCGNVRNWRNYVGCSSGDMDNGISVVQSRMGRNWRVDIIPCTRRNTIRFGYQVL